MSSGHPTCGAEKYCNELKSRLETRRKVFVAEFRKNGDSLQKALREWNTVYNFERDTIIKGIMIYNFSLK
jgi:hypothetical protein